ncbi:MAG: putative lipid II flippase FtsW [Gammaproteobacteria bacterium]
MSQAFLIENNSRNYLEDAEYDWWLIGCVAVLIGIGLVMVASASIAIADPLGKDPGVQLKYFWQQIVALCVGLVGGAIVLNTPLYLLKQLRYLFLLISLVLLVAVISPLGKEVNGASRWLDLGVYNLQASEVAKLLIVIYLAGYMEQHLNQIRTHFSGLYNPVIVMTIVCGLLLMEPDFGTSVLLFATMLGLLFIAGIPLLRIIVWGMLAVMAIATAVMLSPYRLQRLLTYLDPWADPYNTGFQLTQALIAIGRGEWFGVGLGSSVQKLFYLPEAHTDFIFAIFAEELGLFSCLILIAIFTFFIWRVFYIAAQAEKGGRYFPAYLAYGFGLLIGMQAFLNMGVNMGALPTKGLTLPFISYGGNSMIMMCVATALILRVDYETRIEHDYDEVEQ